MPGYSFFRKIGSALVNLNASSSELNPNDLAGVKELSYYIVFGPGTTAGAVQIESAHVSKYAGTWAPEGSPIAWAAADRVHKVSITGASFISKARISTAIVGGSVDIYAIGS